MTRSCIICGIIYRNLKSFIIYEDEFFISFLDSKPLFIGHSLLAPKTHCQTIYDLPLVNGNSFLLAIQKIGKAITSVMKAQGTFIAINNKVSQSINHLHVHLVPRNKGDGMKGFFWPRTQYKNEMHIIQTQLAIKNELLKN